MGEDAAKRRAERAERADYHVEAQRRRSEQESAKAQVLVDRFVAQATQAGLATEELTARPWSGRGRYRTGVVLVPAPRPLGRRGPGRQLLRPRRGAAAVRPLAHRPGGPDAPAAPGRAGCRDGESVALEALLEMRLQWSGPPEG